MNPEQTTLAGPARVRNLKCMPLIYMYILYTLELRALTLNEKKKKGAEEKKLSKRREAGTSLVTQWLRIRLPMQGTWV